MDERAAVGFNELMKQATDAVNICLSHAGWNIDSNFDHGFAQNNPIIVAAYLHAAAAVFTAASNSMVYGTALNRIAKALEDLKPSQR